MPFRRWCPRVIFRESVLQVIARVVRRRLGPVCSDSALPGGVPICCEILDLLGIVRLEGGGYISEYRWLFRDSLEHEIFNPSVFSPAPDPSPPSQNRL